MKITENEVEVAKHQSVIAAIVVVILLLFCLCVVILSSEPAVLLSARRYGLKLTGCCFRLQNALPLHCAQRQGKDDRVKINEQR